MQASQLRKAFPGTGPLPNLLVQLCAYSEQSDGFISCDFELTDSGAEDVLAWFDGNTAAAQQFIIFGSDGMHSLYGYWLYDGRSLAQAPIVYLHGEGVYNSVLANSLAEFLGLLALGKEMPGMVDAWDATAEPCANVAAYRSWLDKELGIHPPADGRAIIEHARKEHPDLNAWIERQFPHDQSDAPTGQE